MAARADSTGATGNPLAPKPSQVIPFRPAACPEGIEPRVWRKELRRRVNLYLGIVTGLLALLDDVDGDCDLEDAGDFEPSLGGLDIFIAGELESDLELDDMDSEGDVLDTREGDEREDAEYSLGWSIPSPSSTQLYGELLAGYSNGDLEAVNEDGDPGFYDSGLVPEGGGYHV